MIVYRSDRRETRDVFARVFKGKTRADRQKSHRADDLELDFRQSGTVTPPSERACRRDFVFEYLPLPEKE
ncbi:MAG: hypothetical protein Q4D81_02965 [Eubacteriales bacterium]|nr:hypothetical protein [Eubacteriales bacterium]